MSTKLSAIVITNNAEPTLEQCLSSLSFTDEVIVVDSGSTDKTVAIAERHQAKVFFNAWPGYGQQKNFGAAQAKHAWLLFIDADEEVSPQLTQAIQQTLKAPAFDIYWLRIITYFLNQPLYHLFGHNPRLFKAQSGRWTSAHVHEQVETIDHDQITLGDTKSGLITAPLYHYSHQTIHSYLKKMQHYTSLDAAEMFRTNKHRSGRPVKPSFSLPYRLAIRQFLKLLIYRQGIRDGFAGSMWSLLSAYYEFTMARKYRALIKNQIPRHSKPPEHV